MPDEPLLEARGLAGGYGGKPVLQGIDLAIWAGEVIAIIGRNGVGKTTLMRALIGLLPLSGGAIRLGASRSARSVPIGAPGGASATCRRAGTCSHA